MAKKSIDEIKTAFFTGHRNIDPTTSTEVSFVLDYLLKTMANAGITTFYAGGALGFDTIAALAVLRLKENFPAIKLVLVLPCKNQTRFWTGEDVETYNFILSQADRVEYIAESYTSTCMHERNRRLVNGSDFCMSFCNSSEGGTAFTCDYAQKKGVEVINLAPLM